MMFKKKVFNCQIKWHDAYLKNNDIRYEVGVNIQ